MVKHPCSKVSQKSEINKRCFLCTDTLEFYNKKKHGFPWIILLYLFS